MDTVEDQKRIAGKNRHAAVAFIQAVHEPGFPYLHLSGGHWSDSKEEQVSEAVVEVVFGQELFYASFDDEFMMVQGYGQDEGSAGVEFTYIFGKDGETDYGWDDLDAAVEASKQWLRSRTHLIHHPYGLKHALGLVSWPDQA